MHVEKDGLRDSARASRPARVWIVGPQPPPVNGQSVYTARMAERLSGLGSIQWLATGATGWRKVVAAITNPLILLGRCRPGDRLYLTPPGNMGLWLFLPTVLVIRLLGRDALVHHHSFRALNVERAPLSTRWLVRFGGPRQTHVLLCERMRRLFQERFSRDCPDLKTLAFSNAHLFLDLSSKLTPSPKGVIGHLSVLSREKGVDHLLAVFERVLKLRPDAKLLLAGPVPDPTLRAEIGAAVARHPDAIDYRGSVAGDAKVAFYRDISIFAFPTRLVDEADPLVILESYSAGRDVVSTVTGCIEERLRPGAGRLTLDVDHDAAAIIGALDVVDRDASNLTTLCHAHARDLKRAADQQAVAIYAALAVATSSLEFAT